MKKNKIVVFDNIVTLITFLYVVILPAFVSFNRWGLLVVGFILGLEKIIFLIAVKKDLTKNRFLFTIVFYMFILLSAIFYMIVEL